VVLATGAYDRAVPFPGWELPGVVTAGAAQALLKGSGVLVGRRVVVAGTGPFLLPVAAGLASAGAEIVALCEAADPVLGFARHPLALARNPGKLAEAAGYTSAWRRLRTRTAVVAAHGTDRVTEVTVARLDAAGRVQAGSERRLASDSVAVSYGFTPQVELPLALGCAVRLDPDGSLAVEVGDDQETSVEGVWAAGEVTGVGGAALAVVEGRLAGAAAAGRRPANRRLRARRAALRSFASALQKVYRVPAGWPDQLTGETLVCRCEEVPASRVVDAVRNLGATEARTVKLLTRAGMGWCQGRVCGYATACLTARLTGRPVTVADLTTFATRPLAQPVRLGQLGELGT
jgi:thioredoxin reductase